MTIHRFLKHTILAGAILGALTACRIDEDLSDCGVDYKVDYQVTLQTNIQTEIDAELTTAKEVVLGKKLKEALSGFFTEYAHDIHLAFYTLQPPQALRHQEDHYIGSNRATYTIYLPAEDYRHLCVANVDEEPQIMHQIDTHEPDDYNLVQATADTVESHKIGLFTARKDMDVTGLENQMFDVSLYMSNAAVALVLQPSAEAPQKVEMFLADLATTFSVNDSIFEFNDSPIVRTNRLADTGSDLLCCYGMNFPSVDTAAEASAHRAATDALRRVMVNVTLADGSITQTVLSMPYPLKAGALEVIKAQILPNGAVVPTIPEIGTSVELGWSQGGEYNPIV